MRGCLEAECGRQGDWKATLLQPWQCKLLAACHSVSVVSTHCSSLQGHPQSCSPHSNATDQFCKNSPPPPCPKQHGVKGARSAAVLRRSQLGSEQAGELQPEGSPPPHRPPPPTAAPSPLTPWRLCLPCRPPSWTCCEPSRPVRRSRWSPAAGEGGWQGRTGNGRLTDTFCQPQPTSPMAI
jgi:hypothetical protein